MKNETRNFAMAIAMALCACFAGACTEEAAEPECFSQTCGALTVTPTEGVLPCNGGCTASETCLNDEATACTCIELGPDGETCLKYEACQCVGNCGNGAVNQGEQCDGTANCTACVCNVGFVSNNGLCVAVPLCGNGAVDQGEQCDGTANCTACVCDNGFVSNGGLCVAVPLCGNGAVDQGEQCDGSVHCTACVCDNGFVSNGGLCVAVPPAENCSDGIDNNGNGQIDAADPACLHLECSKMGIYLPLGGEVFIVTGDGEIWHSMVPNDWTVPISIDGSDQWAKIWVFGPALQAQNGSGFLFWAPGVGPGVGWPNGPYIWPAGPGSQSNNFQWSPDAPAWTDFRLQCAGVLPN